MVDSTLLFRIANCVVGSLMIVGGVATLWPHDRSLRVPPPDASDAARLVHVLLHWPRVVIILNYGVLSIICGVIIISVGIIYVACHFISSIEAPSNMRKESESGGV
ncbi:hypothetical protein BC936DRAFT_142212 [Jimgerdemannia flammicorona]|uniref:Uncharacterized protein n=1 Tax=Jimgerdemannia flammicorona TaxID=994334 RepID=A0A433DFG3_9FUNG|nr:hypothetical protein BC936DRAFT_142212 [Jimgerdemannia flammicorona]